MKLQIKCCLRPFSRLAVSRAAFLLFYSLSLSLSQPTSKRSYHLATAIVSVDASRSIVLTQRWPLPSQRRRTTMSRRDGRK